MVFDVNIPHLEISMTLFLLHMLYLIQAFFTVKAKWHLGVQRPFKRAMATNVLFGEDVVDRAKKASWCIKDAYEGETVFSEGWCPKGKPVWVSWISKFHQVHTWHSQKPR